MTNLTKNKNKYIIILCIFTSLSFSLYTMKDMLTPYVSFTEAQKTIKEVQIIGSIDKTSIVSTNNGLLEFVLTEKSQKLKVTYSGLKPKQFENAEKIVAIGNYDKSTQSFKANKILTKCPSKYESNDI